MLRSTILLGTFAASVAGAQAAVPQLRGDVGLLAGTQPPAGAYFGALFNSYRAENVVGANGEVFTNLQPVNNTVALVVEYSSPYRILGGRWAAFAQVPWTDLVLATPNIESQVGWGMGDVYVVPLQFGWNLPGFDLLASVGGYLPTGRFDDGARGITGLGMWSFESALGGTAHFGGNGLFNASTLASFQVQSRVKGTDKRAGNVFSLEGGAGYSILKKRGVVGVAYYARWKVTPDRNFQLASALDAKDRMFGIGPEFRAPVLTKPLTTIVTARFFIEARNLVATEGNSLFVIANAYLPARTLNHK